MFVTSSCRLSFDLNSKFNCSSCSSFTGIINRIRIRSGASGNAGSGTVHVPDMYFPWKEDMPGLKEQGTLHFIANTGCSYSVCAVIKTLTPGVLSYWVEPGFSGNVSAVILGISWSAATGLAWNSCCIKLCFPIVLLFSEFLLSAVCAQVFYVGCPKGRVSESGYPEKN